MMRWLRLTISAAVVMAAGAWALVNFGSRKVEELTNRASRLESEKRELREQITRLGASRRVAQVDVLDQQTTDAGQTFTRLRWQEQRPDGAWGPPRPVEIIGRQLYVEALVLKFEPENVAKADAQKGTSMALFRRVFGDQQNPQWGYNLSTANDPIDALPENANGAAVWKHFWRLVQEPELAKQLGVRIAQCEAPSVPVQPGQTWEVTLDAVGGLNLRKIAESRERPSAPNTAG